MNNSTCEPRVAEELRTINPHWDGDRVYQEARAVVWAEMQHITWSAWLPRVLGEAGAARLGEYRGYQPATHPGVANVFATAAMRFGHTLINPLLRRLNDNFTSIPEVLPRVKLASFCGVNIIRVIFLFTKRSSAPGG